MNFLSEGSDEGEIFVAIVALNDFVIAEVIGVMMRMAEMISEMVLVMMRGDAFDEDE